MTNLRVFVSLLLLPAVLIIRAKSDTLDGNLEERRLLFEAVATSFPNWTYHGATNGANKWCQLGYTSCCSNVPNQSPIALSGTPSAYCGGSFQINYPTRELRFTVQNTGRTAKFSYVRGYETAPTVTVQCQAYVQKTSQTFTLRELHFHWGSSPSEGSEHSLNGVKHSMEIHLVHTNQDRVFVLGAMVKIATQSNAGMKQVTEAIRKIQTVHATTTTNVRLLDLVPKEATGTTPVRRGFFCFTGSLTTPGCNGGVNWLFLNSFLSITNLQLGEFRRLKTEVMKPQGTTESVSNNFRPIQSKSGRAIVSC